MAWPFALVVGMQLCVSGPNKSCSTTVLSMLSSTFIQQWLILIIILLFFCYRFHSSCSVLSILSFPLSLTLFLSFSPLTSPSLFVSRSLYIQFTIQQYPSKKFITKKSRSYYKYYIIGLAILWRVVYFFVMPQFE